MCSGSIDLLFSRNSLLKELILVKLISCEKWTYIIIIKNLLYNYIFCLPKSYIKLSVKTQENNIVLPPNPPLTLLH